MRQLTIEDLTILQQTANNRCLELLAHTLAQSENIVGFDIILSQNDAMQLAQAWCRYHLISRALARKHLDLL